MEVIASSAPGAPGRASTASPYVVVVHTALDTLLDEEGETSELAGDLERGGLISTEVVRRIACDATIVIGVDDDVGHTMYEGRAQREPTDAQRREVMRRDRHCRFPGCTNVTFTNIHHVLAWKPGGHDRPPQPRPRVPAPPSPGALEGLDHDRQRQRAAHLRRPQWPGHDLAPLAEVDGGDGRSSGRRPSSLLAALVVLPRRAPALLDLGTPALGVDPAHLGALRRPSRRPGRLHLRSRVELGRQPLERELAVACL